MPNCIYLLDTSSTERTALEILLNSYGFRVEIVPSWWAFFDDVSLNTSDCVLVNAHDFSADLTTMSQLTAVNSVCAIVFYQIIDHVLTKIMTLARKSFTTLQSPVDPETLVKAITGSFIVPPNDVSAEYDRDEIAKRVRGLTPGEHEVLQLLSEGCTTAEIAQRRNSSRSTVLNQRTRIKNKLRARGVEEIVRMYLLYKLTENFA